MSFLDRLVAAVTPAESEQDRAAARHNARQAASPGDWLSMVLDHHEQIEAAFGKVRKAMDSPARVAAQKDLAVLLTSHSNAEESVLYPAMAESGEKGAAGLAYEEQAMAKVQMALLEKMDPASQAYADKLEHIRGAVVHHMYQEESHWLVELKQHAPAGDQDMLTARYAEEIARYSGAELA